MNVQQHRAPDEAQNANGDDEEDGRQRRQRKDPSGICHLCRAGQPAFPYEQINTRQPRWLSSMFTQSPFSWRSPFEDIDHCPGQLPALFQFDTFHCWHLGMARNYLGSMLAALSFLEDQPNIDARFEQLTRKYLCFCRQHRRQAHIQKLSKEHINWPSTSHYPTGGWHKGDLSTSLMLWVEARWMSEQWDDPMLAVAGEACSAIDQCLRAVYNGAVWFDKDEVVETAQLGLRFLRRCSTLASMANQNGQKLWPVMPKAHAMHHIMLSMLHQLQHATHVWNPLASLVQQDEDYIGKNYRLSRHMSTQRTAERVADRHLQTAYAKFMEMGYLKGA
eukprot:Skav220942  [mRNA]  locus=scaffold2381:22479:23477:+ [translate_table: standard]